MKKNVFLTVLFAVLSAAFLGSCGNDDQADANRLHVYNWSYYIPEQVLRDFEKKFHVTIVYDVYSSNEEMYTRLKSGGKAFDLVFPSGNFVPMMIREKMVEKIDRKKIPNLKYLDPAVVKKMSYDRNLEYSVPYFIGGAGIAVNRKYVKGYPRDYSIFERSDLKDRMLLLDDMREVMGSALRMLGYSANTRNRDELAKAGELVKKWKKNIKKFDAVTFARAFATGEVWVVQGYLENIHLEMEDGVKKNVDLFIPDRGGTLYIDNMMILKGSKHKDLAMAFINYILEPEVYARIADFLMLPSLNTGARKFTTNRTIYDIRDLERCELKEDVGSAIDAYNKIWQEIGLEN